ncbi:MAG: hypothetical protein LBR40_00415 [Bacilli bacterium]|jgi:hypothetical protein|nr:hypothetical protein [Bacilli bacterium]
MIKRIFSKTYVKLLVIIALLIPTCYFLYANVQINSLTKLGYTYQEAKEMVNPFSIYNIVTREINNLEDNINTNENKLKELGLSDEQIKVLVENNKTKVSKATTLKEKKEEREKLITSLIKDYEEQAKTYKISYKYASNATIYQKYQYIKKVISTKLKDIVKDYQSYLLSIGYSQSEINKYKSKDLDGTVKKLKVVYDKEKKNEKLFSGFSNAKLKQQAMVMFRKINEYRASKGLKAYTYASAKQNCAFIEARAYARNKTPHNWLCDCANENASLASVNSDYVSIAMNFFKNDPPHERVIGGSYSSVAIAFVQSNGMVYMIVDVW